MTSNDSSQRPFCFFRARSVYLAGDGMSRQGTGGAVPASFQQREQPGVARIKEGNHVGKTTGGSDTASKEDGRGKGGLH
jgi:hypothetical protein